jgi:hypothetical protein
MNTMFDENDEVAMALHLLADLARSKGLTKLSDLGDIPPLGSPEFFSWAEREGITFEADE